MRKKSKQGWGDCPNCKQSYTGSYGATVACTRCGFKPGRDRMPRGVRQPVRQYIRKDGTPSTPRVLGKEVTAEQLAALKAAVKPHPDPWLAAQGTRRR